jgi:ABC-type sugar transport system substrate-binding protein
VPERWAGVALSTMVGRYGAFAQTPTEEAAATEAAVKAMTDKERLDAFFAQVELIPKEGTPMVDGKKYMKPGPYRVGLSNGFSGNAWRKMMLATLDLEVKSRPEDIAEYIVTDGQGDDTKQINDLESLISQEVDIILVDPNSGTAVTPTLKKAMDAGILVAVFDLEVVGEDYTFYVATNPVPASEKFAHFLVERVGKGGKIVALGGIPGNTYTAAGWGAAEPILKQAGIEGAGIQGCLLGGGQGQGHHE